MRFLFKVWVLYILVTWCSITGVFAQKQGLKAIDSIKKELVAYKKIDTNSIKSIFRIADSYILINVDSALAYAKTGLAQSKKAHFQKAIAGFYNVYGSLYSDKGDFENAIQYFKLSAAINMAITNRKNLASNLNNIGSAYQRQGNFTQSLDYDFRALKIAEQIKAHDLSATLYNNISMVYFSQKDYARSMGYSFRALEINKHLGNINGMASANNMIGDDYLDQKKLKEASVYYHEALKLYVTANNKIGEATALSQIGLLYDNDPDKKLGYLFAAQKIFDEMNPLYAMAIANVGNIGSTYSEIFLKKSLDKKKSYKYIPGSYPEIAKKAEAYLYKTIEYSNKANDREDLSYAANSLAQIQQKTGNYQSALKNYLIASAIDDSLYSQSSKNKIATLAAQYAFQKKEDNYKQEQQIATLKIKQIYLYSILSIVVVGGILVFLLNRSSIAQLRLRNELQKKEAEEQTLELLHRNKLSESELKAIRAQMNPHFIFNVLNSIESYILENDPKTASRLVQKFAALSRLILENSTQSLVAAEREWKALKLYTELEAMRFNNQFSYSFEADPQLDLSKLMVPPMLVQPLIENSIHHGLRNSTSEGNAVNIKLEQTAGQVFFTVDDNGIGINEAENFKSFTAIKSQSIGLAGIRDRIEIINVLNDNHQASFEIRKKNLNEGPGTVAILTLSKKIR